jgi:apolipoprotein D and lipocalin family protein
LTELHARKPRFLIALLTASLLTSLLSACSSGDKAASLPPPPVVASVDVPRYLGTWYQQALIPNRFQSMCVSNTRATYAMDGKDLSVLNQCTGAGGKPEVATGVAKIVEGSNNAKLRVSFFRPFYGDYWVLALDPDYQWVLVGDPTRQYGWVLSRNAQLSDVTFAQILDRAVALGYDKTRFERSLQAP